MSFESLSFLIFFPAVAALHYAVPGRCQWINLLAASCVFYAAFHPAYLLLLFAMIGVDFAIAIAMAAPGAGAGRRGGLLAASLGMNLGVLVLFKYCNFLMSGVSPLLAAAGIDVRFAPLHLLVPLGLSFQVFQAMSYVLEVHRGNQPPERHFGRFALYMTFFPIKTLGPIERPQHLLPQCARPKSFDYARVVDGLKQMAWGFFKKSVVADRLAVGADTVFAAPAQFAGIHLILATLLYTLQIYADFSGYADIAVGAGKVLGFDLVNNFRTPYFSASLPEFWRRWHISLYSWFNDYLFTPLSVAARDWGKLGVVAAVLITFTLSGLWHGAAWNYVAWGALHGLALSLVVLTRRRRSRRDARSGGLPRPVGILLTFAFVSFTFIFFRAASVSDALYIVRHLGAGLPELARHALDPAILARTVAALGYYKEQFVITALAVAAMFALEAAHSRLDLRRILADKPVLRWSSYYAIVLTVALYGAFNATQPFIYVQF